MSVSPAPTSHGASSLSNPPKVFISYSGDDSGRFVNRFATDLIRNGIDAWYAGWEIRPGDSLVQKILNEGLPDAEAVIVVLSQSSVTKPWVKEELDQATVRRIEEKIRLIPIKLEDCAIPPPLRGLRRVNFSDPGDYGSNLEEIIDVLFNHSRKPALGNPPPYVNKLPPYGQTPLEWSVLEIIGDLAGEGKDYFVEPKAVYERAHLASLSDDQVTITLERLDARHMLEGHKALSGGHMSLKLTPGGAAIYCRARMPLFERTKREVAAYVASFDRQSQLMLDPPEGIPRLAFRIAIDELKSANLIRTQWIPGGCRVMISPRSPLLNDWLEQQ